jgi:hypothetical protein
MDFKEALVKSLPAVERIGPSELPIGSGEPVDGFNVGRSRAGMVKFDVRLGDGAPYTVYVRPQKAVELAAALSAPPVGAPSESTIERISRYVVLIKNCANRRGTCKACDDSFARIEELLEAAPPVGEIERLIAQWREAADAMQRNFGEETASLRVQKAYVDGKARALRSCANQLAALAGRGKD